MTHNNILLSSASVTDKGLSEKRPQNEDSFLELAESGLFAVADGVGGAQAGDIASQMATEILGEAFVNLTADGDVEERMREAITQANRAIFTMSKDIEKLSTMATTVVALHIDGNVATIGHVGDSRLYRLDPTGTLFRETEDHSVVEEEVRAGRLTPQQAADHPSRNIISRALGAEETVEVDLKSIAFEPNTTFLICSDGITRHVDDFEIKNILFSGEDPEEICDYLKKVCYERGAEDNLTAVVVKVKGKITEESERKASEADRAFAPPLVDSSVLGGGGDRSSASEPMESVEPVFSAKDDPEHISIFDSGDESTKDVKSYRLDEGVMGKLFSWLPWLLLLGTLAFGAYYWWSVSGTTTENNDATPAQTANTPLSVFEQNRRNADEDPARYTANNSVNPKTSSDFFLLGRAYLLQKDYKNAKLSLNKAKDILSGEADDISKKVLENDIAILLAITDSEEAQKIFENNPENPADETANSNSNIPNSE